MNARNNHFNYKIEDVCNTFSGLNYWETIHSVSLDLEGMYLADGGHGVRKQIENANKLGLNRGYPATVFPSGTALGSTFNEELLYEVGKAIGEEALYYKINVLLGPSMNLKRDPLCGRNFEYFSEDPFLTGKLAASFIKGVESVGISSCPKHFCLNNKENNRFNSNSVVDEVALNNLYLFSFKIAIEDGKPSALMTSYNLYNGDYVNESKYLLVEKLRNEWGFDGVIISDWGATNNRVKSFKATNDIEMPSSNSENDELIYDAFLDKKIFKKEIVSSFERIQSLDKRTNETLKNKQGNLNHLQTNLCAANESIVLLKNNDNVLPLPSENEYVFIGPFIEKSYIQGGGSGTVTPIKNETISYLIRDEKLNVIKTFKGFTLEGNEKEDLKLKDEVSRFLAISKSKNIVLFFGLDESYENEGIDRKSLNLPQNQIIFIKFLKKHGVNIVGVLFSGSPVKLDDVIEDFNALIYVPLIGSESSGAIINVLTGKVNPSGRLSETWAKDYSFYPASKVNLKNDFLSNNVLYKESIYVGYRYFDKAKDDVLFPFGFGLSYSTFEYNDFKVDERGVSLKIRNTSDFEAKNVIQLYISKEDSKLFRPKIDLKGFKKINLKAHEEKTIKIDFDKWTFISYSQIQKKYVKENGNYKVIIGKNSVEYLAVLDFVVSDGIDLVEEEKINKIYDEHKVFSISDEVFLKNVVGSAKLSYKEFYDKKKKYLLINGNSLIMDLIHSKSFIVRNVVKIGKKKIDGLYKKGKGFKANNLYSGIINQPIKSLFLMSNGAVNSTQLDDIILACNGHFFKGLFGFIKHRSGKDKLKKYEKFL